MKASLLILLSNIPNAYGLEVRNDIYSDYDNEIKITLNNNDEAISCIKGFVDKLRNKNPKYLVEYSVEFSDFINEISILLSNEGIEEVKYEAIEFKDERYDIRLLAAYHEKKEKLVQLKIIDNKYNIGSTVEHNRIISLLNPSRGQ
ncbi:hypothetical protein [Vibrio caribbeanicus]|uniref:hypothetical protein n=1 Tax=Vibrio caribbeanicus TaxID=701175 RepID=UPI0030DD95AB